MTKNLKRKTESAAKKTIKQGIIYDNLANVVAKSKEEIKKRNLKLQQNS